MNTISSSGLKQTRTPFAAIWLGSGLKQLQTKPTRFKQGIVTVSEYLTPKRGKSYWELRYVDPVSGKEVRRRVSGLDREDVKAMAENLTRRAYQGKGYLAGLHSAPGLEDGIIQALKLSAARDYVKANMTQMAVPFLRFMVKNYPAA